jgi:O-antigen ligase
MTSPNVAIRPPNYVAVRWWLHPRVLALTATILAAIAGLTGETSAHLFHQPSMLKYLLTVALPLGIGVLVGMRRAHLALGVGVVLVAPFAFVATIGGLPLSPLTLVLAASVITSRLREPLFDSRPHAALARAALIFAICMSVPVIEGTSRNLYLPVLITGLLVAYTITQIAAEPSARRTIVLAFVVSAGIQAALAAWEFSSGHKLNLYGASNGGSFGTDYFFNFENENRAAAAMPDPIALGNFLALACPISICAVFMVRRMISRLAIAGIGVVLVIGLVATLSRASWIGAVVGTVIALVLLPGRQRVIAVLGLVATMAVAITLAVGIGGSALVSRFNSISNPTSNQVVTADGDRTRLELQHVALVVARDHPLSGVGFGNLPSYLIAHVPEASKASHAHNTYYNLLAEGGAFSALALLAVFSAAALDAVRGFRRDRQAVSAACGAIAVLLTVWMTDYTIRNTSVLAMVAAIFGILASTAQREPWPRPFHLGLGRPKVAE